MFWKNKVKLVWNSGLSSEGYKKWGYIFFIYSISAAATKSNKCSKSKVIGHVKEVLKHTKDPVKAANELALWTLN